MPGKLCLMQHDLAVAAGGTHGTADHLIQQSCGHLLLGLLGSIMHSNNSKLLPHLTSQRYRQMCMPKQVCLHKQTAMLTRKAWLSIPKTCIFLGLDTGKVWYMAPRIHCDAHVACVPQHRTMA